MTHELTDEAKQFAIYITDDRRAMSVGLRYDGSVEFRGCSPDEASRLFWDNMGKQLVERAALLAHLAQRGTSPEGWKLVPAEPTTAMKAAGAAVNGQGFDFAHHTWTRMLLTAPQARQEPKTEVLKTEVISSDLPPRPEVTER